MSDMEVRVEMSADDLKSFRKFLVERGTGDLEPYDITDPSAGHQREPILIAIIVALGGPAAVASFVSLAKVWIQEREKTKRLEIKMNAEQKHLEAEIGHAERAMRLFVEKGGKLEPVTLTSLATSSKKAPRTAKQEQR